MSKRDTFEFSRHVHYYETDAMGVVHHSNYIRFFEEARVAWLRDRELDRSHAPHSDTVYAVVDVTCQYKKPLRFSDEFTVRVQVRAERVRVLFRYAIHKKSTDELVCTGTSLHVAIDKDFKVSQPPEELTDALKEEPWTEIWP